MSPTPKASPTHEAIDQLEPSNLLEPLDLPDPRVTHEKSAPSNRAEASRAERDGSSPPAPIAAITSEGTPAAAERGSRWPLISAVTVAGALACFGAGAALPQLTALFGNIKPSQTVAVAPRPSAPAPANSDQSTPSEPRSSDLAPNQSSDTAAAAANAGPAPGSGPTTGTSRQWVDPVPAAKDAAADHGPRRGPPLIQETTPAIIAKPPAAGQAVGESPRAYTRRSGSADERTQARDSRRTSRRHPSEQQPVTDDNLPTAGYSKRHQDRDAHTTSMWRRERDENSTRDDDRRRRDKDKAAREDGPVIIRIPREDDRWIERALGQDDRGFSRAPREHERILGRGVQEQGRTTGRAPREDERAAAREDERTSGRASREDRRSYRGSRDDERASGKSRRDGGETSGRGTREDRRSIGGVPREEGPSMRVPQNGDGWFGTWSRFGGEANWR